MNGPWVKVCGIRTATDAVMCERAGVDAIGLNFWPGSPRYCEPAEASRITRAVRCVEVVGLFVDATNAEVEQMRNELGLDWVQLHGSESPEQLCALLPGAFKAIHLAGPALEAEERRFIGERILVDASVPGMVGGTGVTADWDVAGRIARRRPTILAGGLRPDNVGSAIAAVRPFGVDVASGVETAPGVKSEPLVAAFVHAAKGALAP